MRTFLTTAAGTLTIAAAAIAGGGVGVYDYSDNVPASRAHPQSSAIPLAQVPMFISLGFDDNGINDAATLGGVAWIISYMQHRKNPQGTGNAGTYDGTAMRASFYMTAKYGQEDAYQDYATIRSGWKMLYDDGHEIGNHSTNHLGYWDIEQQKFVSVDGSQYSKDAWLAKEIEACHSLLTRPYGTTPEAGIGIAESDLYGWRTPHLDWNDAVLSALTQKGYVYDCSMEGRADAGIDQGRSFYWPFTLDNGSPFDQGVGSHPGLWELPCYPFVIPENLRHLTGHHVLVRCLDYDVWARKDLGGYELSSAAFTEILKYNLDQRMAGNRAPMLVGLHSDIYDARKDGEYPGTGTARERQLAIEDFIEYALAKYPEAVRVVPAIAVIRWMRNPVPLGIAAPTGAAQRAARD